MLYSRACKEWLWWALYGLKLSKYCTHRLLCSGMQPYTVVCLTCLLSVCHLCQCLQEVRSKQFKAFRHFLCTTIKSFMSIWVFRDAVRVLTDVGNLFVGYFGSVFYSFVKKIRSFILFSFLFIHFVFKLLHLTRRFRICFVKCLIIHEINWSILYSVIKYKIVFFISGHRTKIGFNRYL